MSSTLPSVQPHIVNDIRTRGYTTAEEQSAALKSGEIKCADGTICEAEIHWFEAHGIGRKDFKIKGVMR
jgi:hypothetical protein